VKTVLRWLAYLYLGYLALSLVILLPAMNFLAPWYMEKQYGRQLSTEIILFDPFRLALEVRHAALQEVDGTDFASLDRAAVNLSMSGLWNPGIVLDELAIEGLNLHLRRLPGGELNVADLAGSGAPSSTEPAAPSAPPALTINNLTFTADRIRVTDEMRASPYSTHWDGLAMAVHRLSTVREEGRPYRLRLTDELGGALEWSGEVSLPDAYSAGTLKLTGVGLRPIWRFIEPWVQFKLVHGRLNIGGNYRVAWGDQLSYGVSEGKVSVTGIDITASDPGRIPNTGMKLGALDIAGIELDGDRQLVQVGSVSIDGFALTGWSEGERVSIAELLAFESGAGNEPAAAATAPGTTADTDVAESEVADADTHDADSAWRVQLAELALNASSVNWRTPFTEPGLLQVAPVNARVTDITWPATAASPVALELQVNQQVKLNIDGSLDLGSGAGELGYRMTGLPLAWFAPNLPANLNAEIGSGEARVEGRLSLDGFVPTRVQQDGAIDDFSVVIHQGEDSLTRWNQLSWQKLQVDLQQQSLAIDTINLDGYSGRVHILKDGTLNIQQAFRDEAAAKGEQTAEGSPTADDAMKAGVAAQQADSAPKEGQDADQAASSWTVDVPALFVSDSEIDYMDESLPVVFRTVIGDLNGEITGISSDPGKTMKVAITGAVDGYAPVNLEGTASPLSQPPALDLGLGFEGVDLARLTPYSGTYAGYAIDQGVLNLKVRYSLQNNHLNGDNKVVIDQLKLGRKIDSDKAVDLPLQLAIALLTDSRGIIDLAVPVSGDVNNPSFSVGSVIAGAFINLITKAVTAPFNLLANLVGTEEDLQRINFAAGTTVLDATGEGKLADLAGALKQRPKLKLVSSMAACTPPLT